MSNDPLQSGRTRALDLDEIQQTAQKKQKSVDDWAFEKWDDPWNTGPAKRTWAEDDRWAGDDSAKPSAPAADGRTKALDLSTLESLDNAEKLDEPSAAGRGWTAPKRDKLVASGDGWDDWNGGEADDGGASKTMALKLDEVEEHKEQGGRRRRQAANAYEGSDASAYGEGHSRRKDIYKAKEHMEYGDRGRQQYVDGQRMVSGGQVMQTDDMWSSSPAPVVPQGPAVLPPSERTVALDLGAVDSSIPTLAPNAKTMGIDDFQGRMQEHQKQQAQSPEHHTGEMVPQELDGPLLCSLVIFTPEAMPVVYEVRRGITTVGRGLENNVVLGDPYASRKHIVVMHREGQFEVRDSGTDNGTSVNGFPISHALLRPGDHIEIGSTVLRFVPGAPTPEAMMFTPPPPLPPHHLAPPPAFPVEAAQAPKRRSALVYLLVFLILFLLAGVATVVVYLTVFNKTPASTPAEAEAETEVATSDMDSGYVQVKTDDGAAKIAQAKAAHAAHLANEAQAPEVVPTSPTDTPTETVPTVVAEPADPILVAGLVGSIAMATGRPKPLQLTVAGEPVTIRVLSDPSNAIITDQQGNVKGYTPYEVVE
ncbi:MAG: FHA domain-containing protein, partial [Myxococcota bacterium]|nr:FHA domain-containing protein [Myxococcota bacterium]